MARVRITYWGDVPVLVTGRDAGGEVTMPLSPRFQELVDALAVQAGLTESDAYLAAWRTGPDEERAGTSESAARAVAAELEAAFGALRARLLGSGSTTSA
jgi:hypothetical protein